MPILLFDQVYFKTKHRSKAPDSKVITRSVVVLLLLFSSNLCIHLWSHWDKLAAM